MCELNEEEQLSWQWGSSDDRIVFEKSKEQFYDDIFKLLNKSIENKDASLWNQKYPENVQLVAECGYGSRIILSKLNLSYGELPEINLTGADLHESIFFFFFLNNANLSKANLQRVHFYEVDMKGMIFTGADMREVYIFRSDMHETILHGANIQGGTLSAILKKADLTGVDLRGANMMESDLDQANLQGADLRGAKITWDILKSAKNLTSTKFPEITISNSDMSNRDFSGVSLIGVSIQNTNLKGAVFRMAHVDNSTLITGDPDKIIDDNTDFTGVGLSEARIDPKLRTRLERNIRKKQWEEWYVKPRVYPFQAALIEKWNRIKGGNSAESPKTSDTAPSESQVPKTESNRLTWEQWLKNIFIDIPTETFWWLSDYGSKTTRILGAFIGLNLIFTALYLWVVPHLPTIRQGATPMFTELMYNTSTVDPVAALIQSNMIVFSITDVATSNLDYIPMFLILVHIVLGYVILAALVTRFAIMFQSLSP